MLESAQLVVAGSLIRGARRRLELGRLRDVDSGSPVGSDCVRERLRLGRLPFEYGQIGNTHRGELAVDPAAPLERFGARAEAPSFLRRARRRLGGLFPYLPSQPRYNERCRRLVLLSASDGTILDFDLVAANTGEREAALALIEHNPIEGATIICDKGFAGAEFEAAVCEPRALILRPSRLDEPDRPSPSIGWIWQRVEAIMGTLKGQLLLERHGGRTPSGLLARVSARILALCACVNLNQRLGLSGRELVPYTD